MIENPISSNNYQEAYEEIDEINIPDPTVDRKYRFEGYQIFQLKDAEVSIADIADADKSRLVAQCDKKNNIARIINFVYDEALGFSVPVEKVKGGNVDIKRVLAATVEKRDWFFGEVIPEALKEMNQVNATNNPDYIPIKTLDDPNFEGRVFFMDETAVDVTNGVPATIAGKEYLKFRAGKMAAGDKQPFHVTLCLTTCSSGENVIPPYVIHSTGSKNDNPDEIKLNLNDFEAFLRQENEALGFAKSNRTSQTTSNNSIQRN